MRTSTRSLIIIVFALLVSASAAQDVCDGVSPVNNFQLDSVIVATGLTQPLLVVAPPGDTDRIFILEQRGVVRLKHRGTSPGTLQTFIDIQAIVNSSGNEQGLLGMAFDPDYDTNGFFYLSYTRASSTASVISRFTVSANPDVADVSSLATLLLLAQPQANHNGGHILFGEDGMLYIGLGDGGGANDSGAGHAACGNGQETENLLGTILRIDPTPPVGTNGGDCGGTASALYGIPADNPLVDGPGGNCDEIYAWGLRNPWRFDIDDNSDLYIADVGQNCWEEVNYATSVDAAGNYGWRSKEGSECFDTSNPFNCTPAVPIACFGSPSCTDPSLIDPVVEFGHGGPCSITGGGVYRGCRMPNFDGAYFYGDFCAGFVRSFVMDGSGAVTNERDWTSAVDPGGALAFGLTSFGFDAQGEIYAVDRSGSISKFVPPFVNLEVSALGVNDTDQLLLEASGNWSWEDLEFNTMIPTDFYRVYRGQPSGDFSCIHASLTPDWAAGDPLTPVPGELLAYVVTAVSGSDESRSGDPDRPLINPCPAP